MNYALEDIKPLKKHVPSEAGGRPSYWNDEVPAIYAVMLRHRLNEREMADLLGIPAATLKSWILGKESMKQAKMQIEAEHAGEGYTHREDKAASYEAHLESGKIEAIQALRRIIHRANSDNAVVSAANALLDRALGKPGQSVQVDQRQTIAYEHFVSLDPAKAYMMLKDGNMDVIEG